MSTSFGKTSRLLKSEDFKGVFSYSHSHTGSKRHILRGAFYTIYWKPRESTGEDGESRLGMSLAKKVIRRANTRNRIKRCLREYFRKNCQNLNADIVVRFTKSPKELSFEYLSKPLEKLAESQKS